MAKNFFKRYVWLIGIIYRNGHIPFEDISRKWAHCSVNDAGEGYLPERTFFNHIEAIREMFDIEIKCDRSRGYYIANSEDLEGDGIKAWLLQSMSLSNMLAESRDMRDRILFEEIPSSQRWLELFVDAMRDNKAVEITYQSFTSEEPYTFTINPYCLKLFKQRWYVLAKSVSTNDLRLYCLDERMQYAEVLNQTFRVPAKFNAEKFFAGMFGVIVPEEGSEKILLKVDHSQVGYFKSLPLHDSQREVESTPEYTIFEYKLAPTFDLKQAILSHGSFVEVLAPEYFRDEIRDDIKAMLECYD